MKVVIEIGGSVRFIAPDAATAARVADLLGQMQPVIEEWDTPRDGPTEYVLVLGRTSYSHRIQIQSLDERRLFKDEAAFTEWQRERAATDAATNDLTGPDGALHSTAPVCSGADGSSPPPARSELSRETAE